MDTGKLRLRHEPSPGGAPSLQGEINEDGQQKGTLPMRPRQGGGGRGALGGERCGGRGEFQEEEGLWLVLTVATASAEGECVGGAMARELLVS